MMDDKTVKFFLESIERMRAKVIAANAGNGRIKPLPSKNKLLKELSPQKTRGEKS